VVGRKRIYEAECAYFDGSRPTQLTSTHHRLECRKAAKCDFGEVGGAKSTTLAE
jgi:hypothetical protein